MKNFMKYLEVSQEVKEALENPVEHLMNGNAKKALEL